MSDNFYAQPCAFDAKGFYFSTFEEYQENYNAGLPMVEEYELQAIDCEHAALFDAIINQSNIEQWFDEINLLSDYDKLKLFYLYKMGGYAGSLDAALSKIDDCMIFEGTERDYCIELFDELDMPNIPEQYHNYIDYNAVIADYRQGIAEFDYNGTTYCAECN